MTHGLRLGMPVMEKHPNRAPFEGVLALIETPSDEAASGSCGHRIVLSREGAEAGLPSLLGMAVNFKDDWRGHNPRQKAGIITEVYLAGMELWVRGVIYARDFPELVERASVESSAGSKGSLGMSLEMTETEVRDRDSRVWIVESLIFVGAAVVERERAGWRSTRFNILRPEAYERLK